MDARRFSARQQDPARLCRYRRQVYFYYGNPRRSDQGRGMDASSFAQIGSPQSLITGDPLSMAGNEGPECHQCRIASVWGAPFIEGSWMTKRNGTYYLQYAAPGTELKCMQTGFTHPAARLGHSLTLHIALFPSRRRLHRGHWPWEYFPGFSGPLLARDTALIGVRHPFERRLVVFPSGFVPDGLVRISWLLRHIWATILSFRS